jgi:hypothetical protein
MTVSCDGWKNKNGTAGRTCSCGTWKNHWLNLTEKTWPETCSVAGCAAVPTLGAHVYHADVTGECIVPMCDACNKKSEEFSLKGGTSIPAANKASCAE